MPRGSFCCGTCLRLLQRGLFCFCALLRQPRRFILCGSTRFCRALERFFRQLFLAGRSNGVEFRLIALARQAQGTFFFRSGFLHRGRAVAVAIDQLLRRGQGALIRRNRRRKVEIHQVAQLVSVGITHAAHIGQYLLECRDDLRVELCTRCAFDQCRRAVYGQRLLVKPRHGKCFKGVHQRHDAAGPGDILTLKTLGISIAVPALMVRECKRARECEQRIIVHADDFRADLGVLFHLLPFRCAQSAALVQYCGGHAQFSDVVQRGGFHHQIV